MSHTESPNGKLLSEAWARGYIPTASGLFLSPNLFREIAGSPSEGYLVGPLAVLPSDAEWQEAYEACACAAAGLTFSAGGTPCEGAGYIVACATSEVLWVLHVDNSEAFSSLVPSATELVATAVEYPFTNVFHVPIREPERLRTTSAHAA